MNDSCLGGGGAGGRVAIYYRTDKFTGTILSYGGLGYECGGAGTVLTKDTVANSTKLVVDNNNICLPIEPNVDWNTLSDFNRGQNSFLTWLYDQDNTGHKHEFEVSCLMKRLKSNIISSFQTYRHLKLIIKYSIGLKVLPQQDIWVLVFVMI